MENMLGKTIQLINNLKYYSATLLQQSNFGTVITYIEKIKLIK